MSVLKLGLLCVGFYGFNYVRYVFLFFFLLLLLVENLLKILCYVIEILIDYCSRIEKLLWEWYLISEIGNIIK